MVNKLLISLMILLFILPLASAAETTINLRTLPNHDVDILIQDPVSRHLIKSFIKQNSGTEGRVSSTFSTTNSKIDALIQIKLNGEKIFTERFESLSTGETIELELPEVEEGCDSENFDLCEDEATCASATGFWYDNACNEKECNSTNLNLCLNETTCTTAEGFWYDEACNAEEALLEGTSEEVTEEGSENTEITGFSIFGEDSQIFSKKIFWSIGIGIILLIIIIIIIKRSAIIRKEKSGELRPERNIERELASAEKKIAAAQEEINRLKNRDKIIAAQKKIQEDQERLDKLRKGEI